MLKYAGIGSRETPDDIANDMYLIGRRLAEKWTLRSGYSGKADKAFWQGAHSVGRNYQMFIPWVGFDNAPRHHPNFIVPPIDDEWLAYAAQFHPAWNRCSQGAQKLHARNIAQILGADAMRNPDPVDMVVCWTPRGNRGGGTGQALRIAESLRIPIFDLAIEAQHYELIAFIERMEADHGSLA